MIRRKRGEKFGASRLLINLKLIDKEVSGMKTINNIHPGEILQLEFLEPMGLTAYRLAKEIGVQQTRISQIMGGKRSITADTAIRLSRFFGSTEEFWMNLQREYDLRKEHAEKQSEFDKIQKFEFHEV
ncbi:HigA family addiction module antitoxin [Imperialibacter sp.]|uniref:HigA family addiction module antitoxin n=1 Tax=Imperialibacter sp. TaxID=2038411 RepID=UPI0032EAA187